jgi:hypothetical protein
VALSPLMIERSRVPTVASTIVWLVPLGKIMTMVSGSGPCSTLRLSWVEVGAEDAIGFVDGCAATRGAAADATCESSISTKREVSGMLMKRT